MFQQGFFQIDPNLTPEELASRRQMISGMMAGPTPRYAGEGLARMASGILGGIANRKLNQAERAGREGADSTISRLSSMLNGQAPTGPLSGPLTVLGPIETSVLDRNTPQAIADDAMTAVGREPNSMEGKIRQGLIQRGIPEHVADAFILNARDESGLRTDINEIAPLVPGSRGGFGLMQWTGPRRRALEAFAAQRGTDVSDLNTQLDFLVTELQGPEARAGQAIMSSKDTPTAAAAIVNEFLRPAEQHRVRREASYLGQAQGGSDPVTAALEEAMQNPWLSAPQREYVMAQLEQRRQANDPLRQLQLERAQLEIEQMRNPQPEQTALQQNVEYIMRNNPGMSFDDALQMARSGQTINVGGQDTSELDKKLDGQEAEIWGTYLTTGTQAAGMMQDMTALNEIIQLAPQGPITGRLAEQFPGFSSAGAAFNAIVRRVAPTLRAPGSGSTSDIEYQGMLDSLPKLSNRPEANAAIAAMMNAKAQINIERANVVRAYRNGEISVVEARTRIGELDQRSIMSPEIQSLIANTGAAGGGIFNRLFGGQQDDGWTVEAVE